MDSLALLLRLVKASLAGQMRYPASAMMLTLGQFIGTGIEVIAVWALFHRFGEVGGWTLGEVAIFYGLVNCMFAIADALGRGFDVLGTEFLRTGGEAEKTAIVFRIRWLPAVTIDTNDRITFAGQHYDLVDIKEIGRKRGLELRAEKVAA